MGHTKSKHDLELRGAINLLSGAVVHVGRWHRVDEYGRYLDPSIEKADVLLRNAIWLVERDLRRIQGR